MRSVIQKNILMRQRQRLLRRQCQNPVSILLLEPLRKLLLKRKRMQRNNYNKTKTQKPIKILLLHLKPRRNLLLNREREQTKIQNQTKPLPLHLEPLHSLPQKNKGILREARFVTFGLATTLPNRSSSSPFPPWEGLPHSERKLRFGCVSQSPKC